MKADVGLDCRSAQMPVEDCLRRRRSWPSLRVGRKMARTRSRYWAALWSISVVPRPARFRRPVRVRHRGHGGMLIVRRPTRTRSPAFRESPFQRMRRSCHWTTIGGSDVASLTLGVLCQLYGAMSFGEKARKRERTSDRRRQGQEPSRKSWGTWAFGARSGPRRLFAWGIMAEDAHMRRLAHAYASGSARRLPAHRRSLPCGYRSCGCSRTKA
jgi:hypothetical protein